MSKWLIIICVAMCLSGCGQSSIGVSNRETSSVQVAARIHNVQSVEEIGMAVISFTQGRHTFDSELQVDGMVVSGNLEVPVGTWEVKLVLMDLEGEPRFQDQLDAVVLLPGQPVSLSFNLRPADASVNVQIDVNGFPGSDDVLRARVYFNDTLKEIIRESAEDPFEETYSLPPGSYDFSIQLYTSSFRATDRVFQGIWQILDVSEADQLDIHWQPEFQNVSINADVHHLPDPPTGLSAQVRSSGVLLVWEPSVKADGYHVFWQPNPWDRFVRLTEQPIAAASLEHHEGLGDGFYSVAAVSSTGIIGYRSGPVVALNF